MQTTEKTTPKQKNSRNMSDFLRGLDTFFNSVIFRRHGNGENIS